jgi:hypothetical protein
MEKSMKYLFVAIFLILTGCGGSDGGPSSQIVNVCSGAGSSETCQNVELENVDASGIYQGTMKPIGEPTVAVIGLSIDDQLYLTNKISPYPDLSSNLPVVTIKADLDIDPFGEVNGNGSFHNENSSPLGDIDLVGAATASSSIRLAYETSQEDGDIELLFRELSDASPDTSQLDNTWTATIVWPEGTHENFYTITLRVSGSGAIIGEDINNCEISGQLETINDQINLYTANLVASNCPEAFDRSGYAYVEDDQELFMVLDYQNGLVVHRLTPPPNEVANGIWEGTFTENGDTFEITGLLYEGEIIALSPDANAMYVGSYAVDGYILSADVTIYEIGGTDVGTASFTGVVNSESQIALNYVDSSGGTGSVSLLYDEIYERSSSLAKVAGNYVYSTLGYGFPVSISTSGVITGTDTDGCDYQGNISTPDIDFNLYEINLDVSSCGSADGSYSRYAALYDEAGLNDGLTVALSNENYIVIADFLR